MDIKMLCEILGLFIALQGVMIGVYKYFAKSIEKLIDEKFKTYEKLFNNELAHIRQEIADIKKNIDSIEEMLFDISIVKKK